MSHKSYYEHIDLEKKDLKEVLSLIYGKRAAKIYVDKGYKLALKLPEPTLILKEEIKHD